MRDANFFISIYHTHLAEVWNVGIEILLVFFDDQMTSIFDLLAVTPLDGAVSKLEEDSVVTIPSFEIDGEPRPMLGQPKRPSAIKVQTT